MGLNRFVGTGRLTKDVEFKANTSGGNNMARFTVAINRNYKDGSGNTQADFIPCVAWGKIADGIKESLAKGSRCTVEGRIQTGSYEGQDGKKVYTTELSVDFVEFLDPKPNGNQGQQGQQQFPQQGQQQFPQQGQQQFPQQGQQQFPQQGQQQFPQQGQQQFPQQGQQQFPQQGQQFPQQGQQFPQQGQQFPQQGQQQFPQQGQQFPQQGQGNGLPF